MMAPNWENLKAHLKNTYQELKWEVHNQINNEIKSVYPGKSKVEIPQEEVNNQTVLIKATTGYGVDP
jgi:hypothetical protein